MINQLEACFLAGKRKRERKENSNRGQTGQPHMTVRFVHSQNLPGQEVQAQGWKSDSVSPIKVCSPGL